VVLLTSFLAAPARATSYVYAIAFQGGNNNLWYYDSTTGPHDTGLFMGNFTSPAIAFTDSGDYEIAFQAHNGDLDLYFPNDGPPVDTGLPMLANTSPSVADDDTVAFHGANGDLWYWNGSGQDTGLGEEFGTSPSITVSNSSLYTSDEIAFMANGTKHLWVCTISQLQQCDTGLPMESTGGAHNGPSIGLVPRSGTCCYAAFQADTGDLWVWSADNAGQRNTSLGMDNTYTSPSIDRETAIYVAFQANNGNLYWYGTFSKNHFNTVLGMDPHSSPAVGPLVNPSTGLVADWIIAFTSNNDKLYTYQVSDNSHVPTGLLVAAETSPSYAAGTRLTCC
jgi:hypothetical protein